MMFNRTHGFVFRDWYIGHHKTGCWITCCACEHMVGAGACRNESNLAWSRRALWTSSCIELIWCIYPTVNCVHGSCTFDESTRLRKALQPLPQVRYPGARRVYVGCVEVHDLLQQQRQCDKTVAATYRTYVTDNLVRLIMRWPIDTTDAL